MTEKKKHQSHSYIEALLAQQADSELKNRENIMAQVNKSRCEFKIKFGAKTTVASYAYFAGLVVRDDQCWHLESNLTTTLACLSARKCQENNSNPLFLQLTIMRKIISDSHLFRY